MRIHGRSLRALLILASFALVSNAQAQTETKTLTVASFGGSVDEALKKGMAGFEEKFNVKIRWVPGSAAGNAAKIVAQKANPEFDVVFLENSTHALISPQGVLAEINPSIVTNYKDLVPTARYASRDAIPFGQYFVGIFYNDKEFAARGWAPPKSWNDLFRPEFCKHLGFAHPNVSFTLGMLAMLVGGDLNKMPEAIDRFGKLKDCVATLEPSSPKLEEKIQLGEYMVGVHMTVRVLPLRQQGVPVRLVIPAEGTVVYSSVAAPVKGSANPVLAQELVNWLIRPESQKILMEAGFWSPTNSKVEIPAAMIALGIPSREVGNKALVLNDTIIAEQRREWIRRIEREMTP